MTRKVLPESADNAAEAATHTESADPWSPALIDTLWQQSDPFSHQCQQCKKGWNGLKPEHCKSCHETFTGTKAGDTHRTGKFGVREGADRRRCRTPEEMIAAKMMQHANGLWSMVPPSSRVWA